MALSLLFNAAGADVEVRSFDHRLDRVRNSVGHHVSFVLGGSVDARQVSGVFGLQSKTANPSAISARSTGFSRLVPKCTLFGNTPKELRYHQPPRRRSDWSKYNLKGNRCDFALNS